MPMVCSGCHRESQPGEMMPRSVHARDTTDFADMRRRIKAIFIGSIGNLVEWYDFYAYAAFALYFAQAFFPSSDPVAQQLNAALLFAAGRLISAV